MSRHARLNIPGELYHIMARGIEKRKVFINDTDRNEFLGRIRSALIEYDCGCFAWALMPNHIHLLLKSGDKGISRFMQSLLTGYAVSFNLRHARVGHLFSNRYKSILCDSDKYLLALTRYIHLNPLRAKLVTDIDALRTYPWCGHGAICGARETPWQQTREILLHFGEETGVARERYKVFVEEGVGKPFPERFEGGKCESDGEIADERVLGGEEFTRSILFRRTGTDDIAQDLRQKFRVSDILEFCAAQFGVKTTELRSAGRSRNVSHGKALAIFLCTKYMGMKNSEVARLTCMRESSASIAGRRGRVLAEDYRAYEKLIN